MRLDADEGSWGGCIKVKQQTQAASWCPTRPRPNFKAPVVATIQRVASTKTYLVRWLATLFRCVHVCVCSLGVINTLRNLPGFLPSLLYLFIFLNTAAKHSYLHGEDSQLLGGQLLHLLGQDLSLLQDGKLTLGITISTGENREREYESPGKSQQASARAAEFIPESAAFARRPTRRFPRCPPRHDGCVCMCVRGSGVVWTRGGKHNGRTHTQKKNFKENYFYNFARQSTRAHSPRCEAPPFPAASDAATPWKSSGEESRSMRRKVVWVGFLVEVL